MKIEFVCPSCGASFPVELDASGLVLCTSCGKQFRARQAAAPAEPSRTTTPSPMTAVPTTPTSIALPPAVAEEIIRTLAVYFRLPKVTKHLGHVNPKKLTKARASYARAMTDAEVPLLLVDKAFMGIATGGMLITNEKVYSSDFNGFFQLAGITSADADAPGLAESLLWRRDTLQLTLNGMPFFKGNCKLDFFAALLKLMGEKCRQRAGLEPAPSSPAAPPEYRVPSAAPTSARAIDRSSPEYRVAMLLGTGSQGPKAVAEAVRLGVEPARAQEIVEQMQALLPPRKPAAGAIVLALCGVALFVLMIVLTVLIAAEGRGRGTIWGIIMGVSLTGVGLRNWWIASGKISPERLLGLWRIKNGQV